MQSTDSKKEREKQTFNIRGIQNSSLEITVNLACSPNRWKRNAVQGLRLGKGPEAGVGETFCMSLFTESRASSINVFTLASYLCTGLFSQSWYWKVSAYLWLFISLFWCFPVIFWHDKCELLWGLRLQLSALCSSPKWPSLHWLLSWGWIWCLCSSAELPAALFPDLVPHWKGKVKLTGVCRLEKCIGFLLLSMLWRKWGGEFVGIFFGSQL